MMGFIWRLGLFGLSKLSGECRQDLVQLRPCPLLRGGDLGMGGVGWLKRLTMTSIDFTQAGFELLP